MIVHLPSNADAGLRATLASWGADPTLFGVSTLAVRAAPASPTGQATVELVERPELAKCPRCWNHTCAAGKAVCGRCALVLAGMDMPPAAAA